jgi:hypothetical protein
MMPPIAYFPQLTACGAPFPIVAELPLFGPVVVLALLLSGAALCFSAVRPTRRPRRATRSRRPMPPLRPTALPQRP